MSYNESLMSNSNYPPMSQYDWDRAPWNEPVLDPEEVSISVVYDLCKETEVLTNDYFIEDGEPNFSETDYAQAYSDNEYGIPDLLDMYSVELENQIKKLEQEDPVPTSKIKKLKRIKHSCEGWNVYEHVVCLND